jgi:hypothetical protein
MSESRAAVLRSTCKTHRQTWLERCSASGFSCPQGSSEAERLNFLGRKAAESTRFKKALRARVQRSRATKPALLARHHFRSTHRGALHARVARCAASKIPCEQGFVVWALPQSPAGKRCRGARFEQALPARKSPNDEHSGSDAPWDTTRRASPHFFGNHFSSVTDSSSPNAYRAWNQPGEENQCLKIQVFKVQFSSPVAAAPLSNPGSVTVGSAGSVPVTAPV